MAFVPLLIKGERKVLSFHFASKTSFPKQRLHPSMVFVLLCQLRANGRVCHFILLLKPAFKSEGWPEPWPLFLCSSLSIKGERKVLSFHFAAKTSFPKQRLHPSMVFALLCQLRANGRVCHFILLLKPAFKSEGWPEPWPLFLCSSLSIKGERKVLSFHFAAKTSFPKQRLHPTMVFVLLCQLRANGRVCHFILLLKPAFKSEGWPEPWPLFLC